ncbi:unnamed protein product [Amoebophrya sp. A120]|nr:unnamed protein product [Amoebophrya sp. A120]|eukprot:GSA120T00002540001.1
MTYTYAEPRYQLSDVPFAGRVVAWKNNYGWIESLEPIDHPELDRHQGRVFCHADDIVGAQRKSLRVGVICEFFLYQDSQGLGASNVVARQVVRLLLPIAEGKRIFSEDGAKVPEYEDRHNVSVRAFEWYNSDGTLGVLPFLMEFWGRPEGIVSAIRELRNLTTANLDFLVPQSRLQLLDLAKLHRVSGCVIQMSNLTAIDDPMPCYPLTCQGTDEGLGKAVLALIDQICDQS